MHSSFLQAPTIRNPPGTREETMLQQSRAEPNRARTHVSFPLTHDSSPRLPTALGGAPSLVASSQVPSHRAGLTTSTLAAKATRRPACLRPREPVRRVFVLPRPPPPAVSDSCNGDDGTAPLVCDSNFLLILGVGTWRGEGESPRGWALVGNI